jgi:hypothetical protein
MTLATLKTMRKSTERDLPGRPLGPPEDLVEKNRDSDSRNVRACNKPNQL